MGERPTLPAMAPQLADTLITSWRPSGKRALLPEEVGPLSRLGRKS